MVKSLAKFISHEGRVTPLRQSRFSRAPVLSRRISSTMDEPALERVLSGACIPKLSRSYLQLSFVSSGRRRHARRSAREDLFTPLQTEGKRRASAVQEGCGA